MHSIRQFLDRVRPNFQKGGKLHMFNSAFDAFETFLFVPGKVTRRGAHIRDAADMKRTMSTVIIALIPAMLFGMWNVGYQHFLATGQEGSVWDAFAYGFVKVLPLIIVTYVSGGIVEVIFAQVRGHEINEGFLVTGLIMPLTLPVTMPLWMIAIATIFAVAIGKEVFGGTGMNILNPAVTARGFLFFAYPARFSADDVWVSGLENGEGIVDGFSGATPLASAAVQDMDAIPDAMDMFLGTIPGAVGETSTAAILLGGLILAFTRVGSLKIMLSVFVGAFTMGLLLNAFAVNPVMEIPPWQHLFMGGLAYGAVYMATDPVTASRTETGKYIYGFLIGFLAIMIRVLNPAFPEGVLLAILFMNVFAPLIDHIVVNANVKRRLKRAKLTGEH